ncbi:DUF1249 domain-containing protein [Sulfurivermis fontis]|jgi:uncharacterized protein YqiB (DUF1249 family)|uniref:DUF1249 domain-containing protein n=1 Tax=Sulfurivermis fontis TaxID=1972068 RepID=UPI000FDA96A9|nr:DUF1249 domain-containing protein [Sulfurivermis fontis]
MKRHLVSRREVQPHPLWLFEENYLLLRRLLPRLRPGARFVLGGGHGALRVEVAEDAGPYTTHLTLSTTFAGDGQLPPPLRFKVRIYHDARLAEVTGYQDCAHIPPRYAARQAEGFQRDERRQVNRLLHEVLQQCRRHGHVAVEQP